MLVIQSFTLQIQLEKQGKRLESLKASNPGLGKKNKKADRLELQLKEQVTKALASLRLKQAVVVRFMQLKSLQQRAIARDISMQKLLLTILCAMQMGGSLFILFRLLSSRQVY